MSKKSQSSSVSNPIQKRAGNDLNLGNVIDDRLDCTCDGRENAREIRVPELNNRIDGSVERRCKAIDKGYNIIGNGRPDRIDGSRDRGSNGIQCGGDI